MMAFWKNRFYELVLGFFALALLFGVMSLWGFEPRSDPAIDSMSRTGKILFSIVGTWSIGFLTRRFFPDD